MNEPLWGDLGKLTLRLTLGSLMLFHGVAKLGNSGALGWIGGQLSDVGLPAFLSYGVYLGEIVGPLMVITGVYCRIGSVLIVISMLFAVLLAHSAELFAINEQGGYALELQVIYIFSAIALALTGSGRLAFKPD